MNAKNWKFGCYSRVDWDSLKMRADAGVQAIEVSLGKGEYPFMDFKQTKEYCDTLGLELWSFHLPFSPFSEMNPASLDKKLRDYTVDLFSGYIKKAADIGCKVITIHPSGEPIPEVERAEQMKCSKDSLFRLAEVAQNAGVRLAVEDIPRTCLGNCSDEISELISPHKNLFVCFDTNHLLIEKNVDFIRKVGSKIITTHVSDYDFLNERHWLPFEGENDWVAIVTALEEVGYEGPFLFEVGLDCPDELNRPRDITFDDHRKIYEACVNKQRLAPIGTPDPVKKYNKVFTKTPLI